MEGWRSAWQKDIIHVDGHTLWRDLISISFLEVFNYIQWSDLQDLYAQLINYNTNKKSILKPELLYQDK